MLPCLALTVAIISIQSVQPSAAPAQPSPVAVQPSPPPYVAITEGVALIERGARVETTPLNMPIVSGDRLRTTGGRMEIRFADGTALDLDQGTVVDVQSDTLLRMLDGRIRMTVRSASIPWRVDTPAGSARFADAGEYRLALVAGPRQAEGDVQLEFAVVRGSGEIFTDHGKTTVQAGERAYASADLLPSDPYPFNSASANDFDRWPAAPEPVSTESSTQYLPSDLQSYSETLDAYGDWQYMPAYGYVWCPRVTAEWRPYSFGRWMTYPRYGLTWVGSEPFAWPTHHYGRWGMVAGRWFWVPASHWAPAHVAWSSAGDSVSWSPLGPNNRAVATASARTVVSRPDFERRTRPVTTAPVQTTTPVPAVVRTTPVATAPVGVSALPRWVNRGDTSHGDATMQSSPLRATAPSGVPEVMAVPRRTTPPANPVPRSQIRPAAPVAPSLPIAERTQPAAAAPAAQPAAAAQPGQPIAGRTPPARSAQPRPAAQGERAQPSTKQQPSQPQRGQPASAPAHAGHGGRGV